MIVEVQVGGRPRRIGLRRRGEGWAVTIDGRELDVDVAASHNRWSLLISPAAGRPGDGGSTRGGHYRSYEIAVEPLGRGEQVVYVDGQAHHARIPGPEALFGRRGHETSSSAASALVAPMPGRIVKVLVKPGDRVVPGQGLVVVEAMKMENELRARGHGTVTAVRVSEGMSIDANAVLITVE